MKLSSALAIATLLLVPAGCGGSSDDPTTTVPGEADPAQVEVIDEWAKALNEGDVDAAAALFAIPSVAQNGLEYEIEDAGDARAFNASLPCGAELVEARPEGALTVATFELTERPGPGACGSGTGNQASTAFKIVDGKITEWRRVLPEEDWVPGAEPAPESSV